jgi:outer membrane protein TolC
VVARTQEDVARRRVEAGDAPARVLLEAEQARLAAERDVSAATEQRIRAEQALHRWTGLPPDAPLEGDDPAGTSAAPSDVAAATARADAAGQALTAARLGWAPDVTARLTGSWTQNEGFAPNGTFVFAGVEASWTFDGGYRSSRVRDAGATAVAAGALAESAQRRLDEERETARAAQARAVAASASATRELAVADTRLREATDAFAQGLLPFSDLERAELAHRAAAVAASRERWAVSLATVELALAGG